MQINEETASKLRPIGPFQSACNVPDCHSRKANPSANDSGGSISPMHHLVQGCRADRKRFFKMASEDSVVKWVQSQRAIDGANMKLHKLMITIPVLILICMVAFSQTNSIAKRTYEIENAAWQMDKDFIAAEPSPHPLPPCRKDEPHMLDPCEYDIPAKYWTDAIKELKPFKIYKYKGCIAIVLNLHDGVEEGLFVVPYLSDYLPMEGYDENSRYEFKRPQKGDYGWKFIRKPVETQKKG